MTMDGLLNDPMLVRDIAVNLISEVIGTVILVAVIGSAIAAVAEARRNARRRAFVLRFLRVCDVFKSRFEELLRLWSNYGGRYIEGEPGEAPAEVVTWRMALVSEAIDTASKIADFASPVLEISDLNDQFEILTGLWRVDGELKRFQMASMLGRDIEYRSSRSREALQHIYNQKNEEFTEFWQAQERLKKKWRYARYTRGLNDQFSRELDRAAHEEA